MRDEDSSMYNKKLITSGGIVKSFTFPDGDIRGDTFYIKHLSDNFTLIDCYLKDGEDRSCRRDEIISEIKQESAGRVCRFISTHPDNDHILGIEMLERQWPIKNFYSVSNNIPDDEDDASMSRYNSLKHNQDCPIEKGIERAWMNKGKDEVGSSGISFLWPELSNQKYTEALDRVAHPGKDESPKPNNISCVIKYSIKNGASYLWLGDMETDMQQEFFEKCKKDITPVDILFHPHHGRESSKPPAELLDAIAPQIIVIGNAPDQYLNRDNSQKTITQNRAGDIVFKNDTSRGYVHVFTSNNPDNMPECLIRLGGVDRSFTGFNYQGSFRPRKT